MRVGAKQVGDGVHVWLGKEGCADQALFGRGVIVGTAGCRLQLVEVGEELHLRVGREGHCTTEYSVLLGDLGGRELIEAKVVMDGEAGGWRRWGVMCAEELGMVVVACTVT